MWTRRVDKWQRTRTRGGKRLSRRVQCEVDDETRRVVEEMERQEGWGRCCRLLFSLQIKDGVGALHVKHSSEISGTRMKAYT